MGSRVKSLGAQQEHRLEALSVMPLPRQPMWSCFVASSCCRHAQLRRRMMSWPYDVETAQKFPKICPKALLHVVELGSKQCVSRVWCCVNFVDAVSGPHLTQQA